MSMHPGQVAVSADTVRRLVPEQFPRWRGLPVEPVQAHGTVSALFRLGDGLGARFPLLGDPERIRSELEAEARGAAELHGRTRFATPEPIAIGEPGEGYSLPWSVQTWVRGTVASPAEPAASGAFAEDLAELILAIRAIDTRGRTFSGSGRGGDLRDHDEWLEECFARTEALLDVPALRRLWAEWRELPRRAPDVMSHTDLIPANVLVE